MELSLSLSPSSALRFSDIRAYRSVNSHDQTKITIKQAGKFDYPSSSKCSQTSLPPPILFSPRKSCSKLAYSYRSKAIPSVRAANAQLGEDKSDLAAPDKFSYNILLKFMRPYALYSALVQFTSVTARTWIENSHLLQWSNWSMPTKTLAFLVAVLCANCYISGINQIFDVEIDKVNKPDLPIAAGELPLQSAWLLVLSYVAIGLLAARIPNSLPFLGFVSCQFLLGTIYSVPPFSTKRSTIGAIVTCGMIQGFVNVFCLIAGARATLGLPFQLSWPAIFISIFATLFSATSGFMKDISDVEGDQKNNVPTLATIIGVRKTAMIGFAIHLLNAVGGVLAAILLPQAFRRSVMIPTHTIFALFVIFQAWKMEKANYEREKSLKIIVSVWLLFLVEYLMFPFM